MANPLSTGRWLAPTTWVYLLVHLLLIVLGYTLILAKVFDGIGASIIAAGVTGIVVFVYIRFAQDATDRLRILSDYGIVTAFEARAARIKPEYDKRINSANNIDVMGFGLNALREDYRDDFPSWAQRSHVRVLLADPNYPTPEQSFVHHREAEEHDRPGSIAASVEAFLRDTSDLRADPGGRFQVHLYQCLPALNIFRVDDEMFWGPYLIGGPSRNNPTFIVRKGGILYAKLMEHFEIIWTQMSKSV